MCFPGLTGSNLQGKEFTLPGDLEGERNLVFVAFQQWHQSQVDTWISFAKALERSQQGMRYYELPTIQRHVGLARSFIDGGMRAGIPDPVARERTITLYIDKSPFRRALELSDEDRIYVLLLDRQGRVLWRAEGDFTPEKGASLAGAIEAEFN
jgi:hypothetical protein